MTEGLIAAAAAVLLTTLFGLLRVLRGPSLTDRIMAAQLVGTGSIGALLLAGIATGQAPLLDMALILALLAAFAIVAMVRTAPTRTSGADEPP
ncbi:multiple resistance and pH regulation protein F [Roseomonas alkaliterrae]|nr:monovalent cation/H+ antiporter complex subunit F [Neoroseomonas alkaliterrae]MBR0676148.1 multiple resistance and pH regulation protein F [Neoroseomonas alkaliterrae]